LNSYYEDDLITIYNADCRDILPSIETADLVLTDPPYGSGLSVDFANRFSSHAGKWWKNKDRSRQVRHVPIVGDDKPFDPSHLLRFPKLILWGGNWYASRLPDSGGWYAWDKRRGIEDAEWPMSEFELAWTNLGKGTRMYRHRWFGLLRDSELGEHHHPTQKPVALMRWCIQRAKLEPGDLVLDPYMGSGPIPRAAKDLGMKCIAIEVDEKYCEIAANRMAQLAMALD